jgi:hypothetical protein
MIEQYTNDELRQALWDVYAILGFDTDGDKSPGSVCNLTGVVKDAAAETRQDMEDELNGLYSDIETAGYYFNYTLDFGDPEALRHVEDFFLKYGPATALRRV